MSVPCECWAWGEHRTKPSQKAREVAACWATLGEDMRECGLAEAPSLPLPVADPCADASFAPKLVRAVAPGERAWPLAFHECMDALAELHARLARTGWLRNDGSIATGTGHLLADLHMKGQTVLVDFAVRLLKHVRESANQTRTLSVAHADGPRSKRLDSGQGVGRRCRVARSRRLVRSIAPVSQSRLVAALHRVCDVQVHQVAVG